MIKFYDKSTYLSSCEKYWSYLDVCLMTQVDLHHRQSPVPQQKKNSFGSTMLYRWEKKETTYLQLSTKVFFHQKKQSQWLCKHAANMWSKMRGKGCVSWKWMWKVQSLSWWTHILGGTAKLHVLSKMLVWYSFYRMFEGQTKVTSSLKWWKQVFTIRGSN